MFIHHTLERAVRLFGDHEAVVCGETRLTYRQVGERVARLAGALVAQGVAAGDRVGILMPNCHRYMETYLAAERAGAVLVPLNHRLAPAELSAILTDAEATWLVTDTALLAPAEAGAAKVPSLRGMVVAGAAAAGRADVLDYEAALAAAMPLERVARPWQEQDLVQLYYTSGTTGRPKGVMLSQRNVMSNAYHALLIHGLGSEDVWLHAAPMFHLADAWTAWTVTWVGARHIFLPQFDPTGFLELVQRERVTKTLLVPTMINMIVNHPDLSAYDTRTLRLITFGASPMPADRLRAALAALPCRFSQLYGMTETSPFATQLHPEDMVLEGEERLVRRLLSCGREIPGVRVRVVRDGGDEVAPGEVGEIIMAGPNVMLGYWRQPEATAAVLRDGWMHSGDLATVDDEGYIFIVDRKKDMIITGGENVYSTEVEDALYKHPAVLEAAVIGVPDERWGERVHAVVVLRPGMSATVEELQAFCRQHIAGYKVPRSVDFAESLPKTGSGKIQKAELRERYWQGYERRVH
jgi:acyl-CoA synthetase (AMP-forming)/AMP-acid ligase II